MALWQFIIYLVPIEWLEETDYNLKLISDSNNFDMSIPWANHQPTFDIFELIDAVMPRGKSYNKKLIVWGDFDTTDIQVWVINKKINTFCVRIDLRKDIIPYLNIIVDITKKLNCMLYSPESNELLKPELSELIEASKKSDAEKFVNNPKDYFDE